MVIMTETLHQKRRNLLKLGAGLTATATLLLGACASAEKVEASPVSSASATPSPEKAQHTEVLTSTNPEADANLYPKLEDALQAIWRDRIAAEKVTDLSAITSDIGVEMELHAVITELREQKIDDPRLTEATIGLCMSTQEYPMNEPCFGMNIIDDDGNRGAPKLLEDGTMKFALTYDNGVDSTSLIPYQIEDIAITTTSEDFKLTSTS